MTHRRTISMTYAFVQLSGMCHCFSLSFQLSACLLLLMLLLLLLLRMLAVRGRQGGLSVRHGHFGHSRTFTCYRFCSISHSDSARLRQQCIAVHDFDRWLSRAGWRTVCQAHKEIAPWVFKFKDSSRLWCDMLSASTNQYAGYQLAQHIRSRLLLPMYSGRRAH
jgi:hypothetical protein